MRGIGFVVVFSLAVGLANLGIQANSTSQLVILDAQVDGANLTINGLNFGAGTPTVILDGTILLAVVSASDSQITVTGVPPLPTGTYLLSVLRANPPSGKKNKKKPRQKKSWAVFGMGKAPSA